MSKSLLADRKIFQTGHRKRMKQKMLAADNRTESLDAYEIVEMLLFLIFKRQDTRTLAKILLKKFKSVSGVINAPKEEIISIEGLGTKTYESFCIVKNIINAVLKENMVSRFTVTCFNDVITYCRENMKSLNHEELRIIFLNGAKAIINDKIVQKGTIDTVEVYTREIVKECLNCGAKGIIMVHNHPSEDPTPSAGDIACTVRVREACGVFNIALVDHIIIGGNRYSSFKNLGLL